jgi:hypothetical protein
MFLRVHSLDKIKRIYINFWHIFVLMLFSGNQEPGQIDKLHKKVFVYFQEDYVNVILETYVEELIQGNNKFLVAHYTSTLPSDSQVMWCAKFLEGINSLFVPS